MLLAAREERLPQSDAALFAGLSRNRADERPHIKLDWLDGETDGLIALTGGPGGPLDMASPPGRGRSPQSRCETLQRLFGDRLYIELQRHGIAERARDRSRR